MKTRTKHRIIYALALAGFLNSQEIQAPARTWHIPEPSPWVQGIVKESLLERRTKELKEEFAKLQKEKERLDKKLDDLAHYRTSDFNEDSDELLLARMMLGEAEDCSELEKIAIVYTAINRLKKGYGKTLKEVILQPNQYSCFNPETDSSIFLKIPLEHNPEEFFRCLKLAKEILAGKYKDPSKSATYYYNPKQVKTPQWTEGLEKIGRIGKSHHIFYREKSL